MKFFIKDFFRKCDQMRSFLRIWSHLLKKSFMENFIFCAVWMNLQLLSSEIVNTAFIILDPFDSSRLLPTTTAPPKSLANVNDIAQFVLLFTFYVSITECIAWYYWHVFLYILFCILQCYGTLIVMTSFNSNDVILASLLLTLNKEHTFRWCFHIWLWTSKYRCVFLSCHVRV